MLRGCRGSRGRTLLDSRVTAVRRARCARQRPKASLQDQCPSWARLHLPRTRLTPVHLHSPEQPARSADHIPQNNGKGSLFGRATHRVTAYGRHAQGSRPCLLCRTICRPGFHRCGGRLLPKSLSWWNIGGTWHIAILSARSQRPSSPPALLCCKNRSEGIHVCTASPAI